MTRYFIFLLTFSLLGVWACDNAELAEPPPPVTCDTLTYDVHLQPIIDQSCAFSGCHDAVETAPGNFTNYTTMLTYLENGEFSNRIFVERNMPLSPGELSSGQMDSIQCWLETGFKEN